MDKFTESLNQIMELAEQVAEPFGLCVVAAKFGQAGKQRTLELTIHRQNGPVSLDDCEQVSRGLEQLLDEGASHGEPLIPGAYMLEVQSPGIDRQLKTDREYRSFMGHQVLVQSKARIDALGDKFTGTICGIDNGRVTLSELKPVQQNADRKKSKTSSKTKAGSAASSNSASHCSGGAAAATETSTTGATNDLVTLDISSLAQVKLHPDGLDHKSEPGQKHT
jgi:ribosome maturation factor RimP